MSQHHRCSRSNAQQQSERYTLTKKFQPAKIPPPSKTYEADYADDDAEYDYDENYSNIRHSTIGVNNPFNQNSGSGAAGAATPGSLGGLVEAPPPDFTDEQSNRKSFPTSSSSNQKNSKLLDGISTRKNSSKFSFNDLTRLNIDKYFSSRKKNSSSSSNRNNNNHNNHNTNSNSHPKNLNSDIDAFGGGSRNGARKSSSNASSGQNKPPLLVDPFTTKIIRDPDTNEILSVKPISLTKQENGYEYDYESSAKNTHFQAIRSDDDDDDEERDTGCKELDRSNVSIVDVGYENPTHDARTRYIIIAQF